jgi:hypothetical protein
MSSFERLEIYNRVYWFRILSALAEDFPGLRAIVGQRRFDKLLVAYLNECPSQSFTLRNLGSRLETWLRQYPEYVAHVERLALDMVRLEWADIEAYDGAEWPRLTEHDLNNLGEDPTFHLQPHLQLLDLAYPVDSLLLNIRDNENHDGSDIVSNVVMEPAQPPRRKRIALPKPEKVHLAVYRLDYTVYFKRLDTDAFALLQALRRGINLSAAIDGSAVLISQPVPAISQQLQHWFANWAELGWFCKPPDGTERS